jgi:CRISPR/Cas system CMR-associated protein Cmr5 small subunit
MQAKGKKGELLQRAIQELLETLPEEQKFSLLTTNESFWNTDLQSIQKELQNLDYSATAFELEPILTQIQARPSLNNKEILIITDGKGVTSKTLKTVNNQENVSFHIPKVEQQNNVSVDSVFIRKSLEGFYEIGVQISNYGENSKAVSLGIYDQQKLVAKSMIKLDKQKQVFPFTIPKKGFHGFISIVDNGLAFDNTYYFSIGESQKTKVISIGEASKSTYLSRIYTNDEFEYQNSNLSQLDFARLEVQDVLIVNEIDEISQALQTTLQSFAEKGGTLIVIPSVKTTISNLNSLLNPTKTIQYKSLNKTEKLITKIHFSNPIFKNVFDKQINNFQYPKTKVSFDFNSFGALILSYQDQTPFLQSSNLGLGKVFIFSAPLNTDNSNFQQSPLIVPVFYKLAQSEGKNGIVARTIGNSDPYLVNTKGNNEGIFQIKNKKEQFIPIQQILSTKVKMNLGNYPKKAGNFEIFNNSEKIENCSFNYDRTESNSFETNQKIMSEYSQIDSLSTFFNAIQTENNDSQIWKWFLIFALLFLLTETAIIRFVK